MKEAANIFKTSGGGWTASQGAPEKSLRRRTQKEGGVSKLSFSESEMRKAENLLKSFPESRLALSCKRRKTALNRALSRIAVFRKEAEQGPLFVFAMGGSGAAARLAKDAADAFQSESAAFQTSHSANSSIETAWFESAGFKNPLAEKSPARGAASLTDKGGIFHIGSWDERALQILHSLSGERLKHSRFLFVSKSGRTAENRFYLEEIEKQFRKESSLQKPAQGQIRFLTGAKGRLSPAASAVKKLSGAVLYLRDADALPGRFSFLTESGLLQFGLFGGDPSALIAGFESALPPILTGAEGREKGLSLRESRGKAFNARAGAKTKKQAAADRMLEGLRKAPAKLAPQEGLATAALAFFLRFLDTKGGELFFLTDEGPAEIASWFESAWAESLSLSHHPVRAVSFSGFLHGQAEGTGRKTFILSLNRRSEGFLGRMQAEREKALRRFCIEQGTAFLPLNIFKGGRSHVIGQILALLFQVTEGAGRSRDIYAQPKVDKLKKTLYNQMYGQVYGQI